MLTENTTGPTSFRCCVPRGSYDTFLQFTVDITGIVTVDQSWAWVGSGDSGRIRYVGYR